MKRFALGLLLLAFITALSAPLVFAEDSPAATQDKKEDAKDKAMASHEKAEKKMSKVDINSAEKEDLLEVKGIDDATADKIIAGRPWASKADLKTKGVVDAATYKMISSHLVVKKPKAAKKM
jgi:DNA uptake protein ComE-like DNA-binding protein